MFFKVNRAKHPTAFKRVVREGKCQRSPVWRPRYRVTLRRETPTTNLFDKIIAFKQDGKHRVGSFLRRSVLTCDLWVFHDL